jgi:hypothetical protein
VNSIYRKCGGGSRKEFRYGGGVLEPDPVFARDFLLVGRDTGIFPLEKACSRWKKQKDKTTRSLRNDLGHLSCINHDISHRKSSDEDRGGDDSGDPGIMLSQLHLPDIMRDQFINLEGQRKEDAYSDHKAPEKEGEFPAHDQVDGCYGTSWGDI